MNKTICLVPRKNVEKFCQDMAKIKNKTAEKTTPDHEDLVRIEVTRECEIRCPRCMRSY